MSDAIAAGRYTRALFQLAEKKGVLKETDAALHALARTLEAQPKILLLIANPTLTSDEKNALALKTLGGNGPELLERFLRTLIEKKRFALLPEIQGIFHSLFEEKQGVQEVEMISPVPFSQGFFEKLKAVLAKKLRLDIRLIPRIDPRLLGGFILRFSGKEIDCSFKNRLYEIQQKLLSEPAITQP